MKKILSAVLVLSMFAMLLFAGCSGTDADSKNGGDASPGVSDNNGNDDKSGGSAKEDEKDADDGKGGGEFARGSWSGNTYTSEYAGITFKMPDSWNYGSDEEIANLMGVASDIISEAGMEFSKEMLELQNIYDMMAQDPLAGTNVIVMYENLSMSIGGSKYTEAEYLDLMRQQLESMDLGFTFGEITDATVGGITYKALSAMYELGGVEQCYYVRKIDNRMLAIIVSVYGDDSIDDVIACFS